MPKLMKKAYTLSSCDTSRRILKQAHIADLDFEIRDIKASLLTTSEVEKMKALAGSYEALFSRRSRQYISMGLKNMVLKEADYKRLILQDYTFLKRPVIIDQDKIFIGNTKANIEALLKHLGLD